MFFTESFELEQSNPMLWIGIILMVIAIIGYFMWNHDSKNNSEPIQYIESNHNIAHNDQPTVATCIINESGEQVCN